MHNKMDLSIYTRQHVYIHLLTHFIVLELYIKLFNFFFILFYYNSLKFIAGFECNVDKDLSTFVDYRKMFGKFTQRRDKTRPNVHVLHVQILLQ